jgi:hypothetical protein
MLKLKKAEERVFQDLGQLDQYVADKRRTQEDVSVKLGAVRMDGAGSTLLLPDGRKLGFRETGFKQLCGYLRIPSSYALDISPDLLEHNLEKRCAEFSGYEVILRIEEGDVRAVVSERYQPMFQDRLLDLIQREIPDEMNLHKAWVDGEMMRLAWTSESLRAEPQRGDITKIGVEVINGETGYHGLAVSRYALRLVCSNGMVAPVMGSREGFRHIGAEERLRERFRRTLRNALDKAGDLVALLERSVQVKVGVRHIEEVQRTLQEIMGKKITETMVPELREAVSLYDLFNVVTAKARDQQMGKRRMLEVEAGTMLAQWN